MSRGCGSKVAGPPKADITPASKRKAESFRMVFIEAKATRIRTNRMNSVKAMYRTRNILARTISEIVVRNDLQKALPFSYRAPQSSFAFALQLRNLWARQIS